MDKIKSINIAMIYHGIILGGNRSLVGGRNIAGFRLRTAAKKHGYNILPIDSSVVLTQLELENLLDKVITKDTLMIGISTVWLNSYEKGTINWLNDSFFQNIKTKFPHVSMVSGGPAGKWVEGSHLIYEHIDWNFNGFSDISFPKFLDLLSGKKNHGLMYMPNRDGKKIVNSDVTHKIYNPDDIETVFELEDGFLPHQPLPLEVSRGCIFRCSFCNHPFQGAKDPDDYIRSVDSISSELRRNYDLFGTTRYSIMDDTFNDSIEKLDRLRRAIDKSKIPSFEFMSYIKPELLATKPEMIPILKDLGIASGFSGIESFHKTARKAIKKGMDIERVLEAIELLKSSTGCTMHASFIVGLPGESLDDIYRTHNFLRSKDNRHFNSWIFQPMGIYYDSDLNGFSEIDKNPEKFGYEIIEKTPESFAIWKSPFMSRARAISFCKYLNSSSLKHQRIAGWDLPLAWQLNLSKQQINDTPLSEFRFSGQGIKELRRIGLATLYRFGCL